MPEFGKGRSTNWIQSGLLLLGLFFRFDLLFLILFLWKLNKTVFYNDEEEMCPAGKEQGWQGESPLLYSIFVYGPRARNWSGFFLRQ